MRKQLGSWIPYLAVAALLVYFMTQSVLMLQSFEGWYTRPPLWDQASHVLDAIHFSQAFRTFSLQKFFVQLHNSSMWPPVIPLLQAPFLLIFGESFINVRNWIAWSSIPAVLMVAAVGWRSHRRFGLFVGAWAAALIAVSPMFLEFCLQEMMEVPGIMLSMLTLYFYLSFLQSNKPQHWRATCLSGIVLFFAKFNYAVAVMLPIVVCEFCRLASFRWQIFSAVWAFVRDTRWRSSFTIFVLAYVLFLFGVHLSGGLHFKLFGRNVTLVRAFGNPVYILLIILLVRNLIVNRPLIKYYAQSIWQADEPVRSLLRFVFLPAAAWMLYPPFFSTFFIFIFSEKTRHSSFFSMETLTFYPGAWLEVYAPHPLIGVFTLGSLFVLAYFWRKLPLATRFLLGMTLFNLFLTITHPNYQTRYLLTTAPLIFLVSGLAIAHGLEFLLLRSSSRVDAYLLRLAPLLTLAIFIGFPPPRGYLLDVFNKFSHETAMEAVFAAVCQEAAKVERNTFVGFSTFVAPASIALRCYQDIPEMRRSQMPTAIISHGFHGEKSAKAILESRRIEQYFVVDYSGYPIQVGREQEPHLIGPMRELLPQNPDYESFELLDQSPTGLKITVYRLKSLGLVSVGAANVGGVSL